VLNVPDYSYHWLPLPKQKHDQQITNHNEGAALNVFWNESRPPLLEAWSRHHTVLDSKDAKQDNVN
jgi:hypothetical protein